MRIMKYLKIMLLLMVMFYSAFAFSQNKLVKGIVTDSNGEVLIGVAVQIPKVKQGTITDADGRFSLQVSSEITKLSFSYVGMQTVDVPIPSNGIMSVAMTENSILLDEMVVVGYGTMSKKNLTTAIAKVDPDKISKPALSNMSQMLMGRAAGLQATVASSQPGGGVDISIRGGGTPIYVIDGVVTEPNAMESSAQSSRPNSVNRAGLAGLNPEDIESIEVLKDGAAAIYGLGASNGVILITTKKGKAGKMKLSYDGSVSLVTNNDFYEPLDAKEYMKYANLYSKEMYLYNNKMGVYGSNEYDNRYKDMFTPQQINEAETTDWLGMVLRDGSISNHNLSLQGGNDKLNYYLSGNYYKHKGNVSATDMERYTLRSVVSAQVFKFLKIANTINLNVNDYHNGSWGAPGDGGGAATGSALASALKYPTYLPLYDQEGNYTIYDKTPNPKAVEDISDISQSSGFHTNFTVDVDIWKKILTAKLIWGYTKESSKRDVFIPSTVYFEAILQPRGSMVKDARTAKTLEGILNFNKSFFDEKLRVDLMAGMGQYITTWDGMSVKYKDINDAIGNDNIGAATGIHKANSYRGEGEKRSQFTRLNLDLYDRYNVSVALRRDGTDKFFPGKKYSLFPSVSVGWKIFNEKFMSEVPWVNLLKIRASYGVTGSDNLGTSLYGYYGVSASPVYFDTKHIPYFLNQLDYSNVTWERNTMKNIGVDFSILKDRISGSFDYFWNDITDMLGSATSNGLSMFASYPINGGHIRKFGWDMSVNTVNVETKNFKWTSNLTLSANDGVWIERFPNYDYRVYQKKKNEPLNARYYYRMNGIVNADLSNVPDSQPQEFRVPGFPIIEDLNNDGQIDVNDIYSDNNKPSLYWGLGNHLVYKNWDLDIFMYSQLGVNKYNFTYEWCDPIAIGSGISNQAKQISQVWNSIDNPNGTIPGVAYRLNAQALPEGVGINLGDEDASFVRIRNITLGYNFTKKMLGRMGEFISSIRIYCDVQNPFIFTSFSGLDPEVVTGGWYKGGKAEYPQTKTFSFGLKLSL